MSKAHPTRIFHDPEDIYKVWEEYKADIDKQGQEWLKIQYVGKEGERKTDPSKVPYTLEGFERFCAQRYGCVSQYFDNKQGYYDEFVAICTRIRKEIRENQIVGGLLGFYNPSITARLNNLTEKVHQVNEVKGDLPEWLTHRGKS